MGKFALIALIGFFTIGCKTMEGGKTIELPKLAEGIRERPSVEEKIPDFKLEEMEVTPLSTLTISLHMRAVPLRDILFVIARDAGLNLVIENGVDPEAPVTLVLERVKLKEALEALFSTVPYFYEIKGNLLIVKALDTKAFRVKAIPVSQTYSVDVGGDILGSVMPQTGGTLKGAVSRSEKSDDEAYKLWDAVQKALGLILTSPGESFVINRLSGTIMVTATKPHMEKVERFLKELNLALSRQVLIEAKVIEVTLNKAFRYGIDWSYLREQISGSWTLQGEIGARDFISTIPTTSPFSQLRLHFFKGGRDLNVIIKALSEFGDLRTLSNPRVSIMNGQTALLTVGRSINFISRVETTTTPETGVTSYTIETSSLLSGLMIGIVPHVSEEGEISLTITPIVSNLIRLKEVSFGTQYTIQLPEMDLRELSTSVKLKDREILLIGGLMKKEEKEQNYGIPLLKDIPLVGGFFKGKALEESNTELVIILQARVIS